MDRTCLRAILRITSAKGLDRIPTSLHIKFVNNWILGLWLNSEEIKCGWSKFCNCLKLLQRCLLSTRSLSFLSHFLYKHFLGVYKAKASTDESLLTPVLKSESSFLITPWEMWVVKVEFLSEIVSITKAIKWSLYFMNLWNLQRSQLCGIQCRGLCWPWPTTFRPGARMKAW